ncbi:PD-(D/E)XK nuclease family protein [Sphingomicrobium clamense]|uniref:PD-(D/E)XK nuclease family protein n=1 Tax=Sphingomicrobium clamense TaxID=2851013 RepID=A0ABS6V671_9SPHN|nr:PD-(D/E)XK nuclease family protein [Sphingomicrobium sp. B8]MBW0145063.1 PD-(D/E)XK nuclease family protein [Sphingomicrobium sp. B8]
MSEGHAPDTRPTVYSIAAHRSFADALAIGLIREHGKDPLALARGRILLPTNRAVRAVREAFVRASGSGLLLPRLIPIGDPELVERIGAALDPADHDDPLPPAIAPRERQLALAKLLAEGGAGAVEAMRRAQDLGALLDQLEVEQVSPLALRELAADHPDLEDHWERLLGQLALLFDRWPALLEARGQTSLATRRNALLGSLAERWRKAPPEGFTIAAGITTAAPAVAGLLSRVARLPEGAVILPALAMEREMPTAEWDALRPEGAAPQLTHPQYHLRLLLDRMGVARDEVEPWRHGGRAAAPAVRARAVAHAMASAAFSDKWVGLAPPERRLTGVRVMELPDPAIEATAIAIAMREVLETPEKTAALVTPDRQLARRVSQQLRRWGIHADDSAGTPLSQTPLGTLLLGIIDAVSERFAPVPLLGLIKHPLVGRGDRGTWLRHARKLDGKLRGPRPPEGIEGLDRHFGDLDAWSAVRPKIVEIDALFSDKMAVGEVAGALRRSVEILAGEQAWAGQAGRVAGELIAGLEQDDTQLFVERREMATLWRDLLDQEAVRPVYGGHPRLNIWGLLEARLQQADVMILGGLNEGSWPAAPKPDPWLAPRLRRELGLQGLDYRTGLAAHDLISALGAPRVILTRAVRDGRSPTVASRFLLRLQAMTGGLARDHRIERLATSIDNHLKLKPTERPRPTPPPKDRPRDIYVTAVDRLKGDPFAFYAQAMLRLRAQDPVDGDHHAKWKGDAVHKVLEDWLEKDRCDPAKLRDRVLAMLDDEALHPMLRALWEPRLMEAIDFMGAKVEEGRAEGREPLAAERRGKRMIGDVTLHGIVDRIDRIGDKGLAIVDYKTGKPPSLTAVREGFALQLGLLGLIAEAGGFEGIEGAPSAHEYWSLAKRYGKIGFVMGVDDGAAGDFLDTTLAHFIDLADDYLTGNKPFTAKLNPAYAPYGDYDQLMRLDEWYGRE